MNYDKAVKWSASNARLCCWYCLHDMLWPTFLKKYFRAVFFKLWSADPTPGGPQRTVRGSASKSRNLKNVYVALQPLPSWWLLPIANIHCRTDRSSSHLVIVGASNLSRRRLLLRFCLFPRHIVVADVPQFIAVISTQCTSRCSSTLIHHCLICGHRQFMSFQTRLTSVILCWCRWLIVDARGVVGDVSCTVCQLLTLLVAL